MTTEEYKDRFETVVEEYIKREGIKDLLEAIAKTDFYTAPASTKYHDSHENGLVKHSLEVFDILYKDLNYQDEISLESIAIVALFHDLCKTGFYEVSTRNTKDEKGKWIQVPYYTVNDLLPMGHGSKSVILIQEFMKLSIEEIMAINWHMGLAIPKEDYRTLGKAFSEFPLALYLHIADMKATYL